MVDVEAIRPDADDDDCHRPQQRSLNVDDCGMGNVLRHDAERLRVLLERHLLYTGSARAAALLDDWQNAVTRFDGRALRSLLGARGLAAAGALLGRTAAPAQVVAGVGQAALREPPRGTGRGAGEGR